MTDHSSIGHFTLRALLGAHSDELVGAAPEPTDDEVGFTVDRLRHGGSIVTMLETCDLSFVFARCREVSNAILDQGEDTVTFTRDEDRAASRLAELRAMRGRWRTCGVERKTLNETSAPALGDLPQPRQCPKRGGEPGPRAWAEDATGDRAQHNARYGGDGVQECGEWAGWVGHDERGVVGSPTSVSSARLSLLTSRSRARLVVTVAGARAPARLAAGWSRGATSKDSTTTYERRPREHHGSCHRRRCGRA
jgi:hypothetical protein